jgi:hypothetical protein
MGPTQRKLNALAGSFAIATTPKCLRKIHIKSFASLQTRHTFRVASGGDKIRPVTFAHEEIEAASSSDILR